MMHISRIVTVKGGLEVFRECIKQIEGQDQAAGKYLSASATCASKPASSTA